MSIHGRDAVGGDQEFIVGAQVLPDGHCRVRQCLAASSHFSPAAMGISHLCGDDRGETHSA
jgi:hypothetical protein